MKAGYTIEKYEILKGDDCILIGNLHGINEYREFPTKYSEYEDNKSPNDVGIWKIKYLKS